jgi:DNA-binding Xre family transcriptional regulator
MQQCDKAINMAFLVRICTMLNCDSGNIMQYVKDTETG